MLSTPQARSHSPRTSSKNTWYRTRTSSFPSAACGRTGRGLGL